MANNDPVSGLMASMAKVRQRRPEGMALDATTAAQAGTVLPQPRVSQAQAPSVPASYREVLPMPASTMPLESPESPVEEFVPASGPEIVPVVAGTASALMRASLDMSLSDAYLLSLGYLFGVEEDEVAERQATPEPAPMERQATLNPQVAESNPLGTLL